MIEIDNKYNIKDLIPLQFEVIKIIDYLTDPFVTLEGDAIGNMYIGYLIDTNKEIEQRLYVQISKKVLKELLTQQITVKDVILSSKLNYAYIINYLLETGLPQKIFLIPSSLLNEIVSQEIPDDYYVYDNGEPILETESLLFEADKKNAILIDFLIKSPNLIAGVKPYVIDKILNPIIKLLRSFLELPNQKVDNFLSFSNIRQSSFGATIEIYSEEFFKEKEDKAVNILMELFSSEDKTDFDKIISETIKQTFINDYSTIIKTLIKQQANFFIASANPISKEVKQTVLSMEKAAKIKEIIDEEYPIIEDIEEINGKFYDINIKTSRFVVKIEEEDDFIKGKIDSSLIERIKQEKVNLGSNIYRIIIKTVYHPPTTVKEGKIERFLIDYSE